MILNLHRNRMGTASFDGKFTKMNKPQEFIVYPIKAEDNPTRIEIQSDTRFGYVNLEGGEVSMSASHSGGAGNASYMSDQFKGKIVRDVLPPLELAQLITFIRSTGSKELVGDSMVKTDNSGALLL